MIYNTGVTSAAGALLTGMMVCGGTYAEIPAEVEAPLFQFETKAGSSWLSIYTAEKEVVSALQETGASTVAEAVNKIKTTLGIPAKDLATLLGVSRPTLYSYIKNSELESNINSSKRKRAIELSDIASKLNSIFLMSPGAMVKNFSLNGVTMFELLKQDELNHEKIIAVAKEIEIHKSKLASVEGSHYQTFTLHEITRGS
jgi:predicted regulator of amino acid metabolism with ACT domain